MKQNSSDNRMGPGGPGGPGGFRGFGRPVWFVAAWFVLALATIAAIAANERWRLLSELDDESAALHRLASQRAGQHDAHMTALSAVALAGGESGFDLFLDVANALRRFYPRIEAVDLVPVDEDGKGVTTRASADPAVDAAIRAAVQATDGSLVLGPMPGGVPGHYLLVKRSPNSDAAIYGLGLEIDAQGLLDSDRDFWQTASASQSLVFPDGALLIGDEIVGPPAFERTLGSASQPLVLRTAVTQHMAALFPMSKIVPALIVMTVLFLAGLALWQQWAGRMQAERAAKLSARETRLAHASRVNSLGEMASGIAHELTQPLTAILTQAQAGRRLLGKGDTQAVASVLDELVAQARRGADILSHLRQWIRPPRGETGMTDLNAAIGGVEALLAPEARKRSVKLKLDLADEALAVRADRTELEQVIFNLVRNAFEALEETQDGQVSVTSCREAGLAILDVYDNGPGVDEALAGQVFEPFVTGKEQGTGLGLSLSQRIVERMNGEIELLPSQGGARFQVRLPLASQRHEIKHDDGRVSA